MEITLAVLTVISYVCEAWYYILKDIHNIWTHVKQKAGIWNYIIAFIHILSKEKLWSRANEEPVAIKSNTGSGDGSGTRYERNKRRSRSKHSVGTHRVSESEEDQKLIGGEAWRKRRGKKEILGESWEP
jgi:hypothetical protein